MGPTWKFGLSAATRNLMRRLWVVVFITVGYLVALVTMGIYLTTSSLVTNWLGKRPSAVLRVHLPITRSTKTPTLVVHSEQDHRCPFDQAEQLYMSLKYLSVSTELVRFPNESYELLPSGRPWHRTFAWTVM